MSLFGYLPEGSFGWGAKGQLQQKQQNIRNTELMKGLGSYICSAAKMAFRAEASNRLTSLQM